MNIHSSLILKKETKSWQRKSSKFVRQKRSVVSRPSGLSIQSEGLSPWRYITHSSNLIGARVFPFGQIRARIQWPSAKWQLSLQWLHPPSPPLQPLHWYAQWNMQACTSNTPCCQVNLRHSMRNSSLEKVRILRHFFGKRDGEGRGVGQNFRE